MNERYSGPVHDAIQPVKEQLSPQDKQRKRELRQYLGGAYHRLDCQLKREGRCPWHLSESEVHAFIESEEAPRLASLKSFGDLGTGIGYYSFDQLPSC